MIPLHMNRLLSILLLCCIYSHVYAQTPYDAFALEVSRPILDVVQDMDTYKDSLQQTQIDTTQYDQKARNEASRNYNCGL